MWVNGQFQYCYLYNADYGQSIGTAWRLATSTHGVAFHDQGVAAPKKTNANYDLWSGSVVVDSANTAGFGAGAIVALVTQMDHPTPEQIADASGPQAQFLWYSTDGGRNFRPYGDTPVLANGGRKDFRDPKLVWDSPHNRWVALLAQGDRIGFWTSPDLKSWTFASEYVNGSYGTLECPDLYQLRADDGTLHWVLGASANGYLTGDPNTYAYWTGSFDGTSFTPDAAVPQWLDRGLDWYGGVTWEDPAAPLDRRYAIGWMNNWSYPYNTPTWAADGFNGTDSITRQVTLRHYPDGYALASRPVPALDQHATRVLDLGSFQVDGKLALPYHGTAYQLEADVSWSALDNLGVQLRVSADGTRHADAGIYRDVSYLNRRETGNPDPSGWREESHAPYDRTKAQAHLRILVDRTTVEYFVDEGRYPHSSEVFADPADDGTNLFTSGGAATFANVKVTEFENLAQRPAELLADFEGSTYGAGWSATGSFAGTAPTVAQPAGSVGRAVLDTFVGGGHAGRAGQGRVRVRDRLESAAAGGASRRAERPSGVDRLGDGAGRCGRARSRPGVAGGRGAGVVRPERAARAVRRAGGGVGGGRGGSRRRISITLDQRIHHLQRHLADTTPPPRASGPPTPPAPAPGRCAGRHPAPRHRAGCAMQGRSGVRDFGPADLLCCSVRGRAGGGRPQGLGHAGDDELSTRPRRCRAHHPYRRAPPRVRRGTLP
ncbi:glycoside hydrolase family 32 protein [Kitasatospora sp. NPDC051914]|uniref:glycoside hydrolase family 32 protein n=1 Tax=Kitasatospora sp. NPDC051914 TaxID=3154945 RepID=UPI00342E4D04